ncbi:histidine kinase dimerization/phospho-acceptor domain-containing protein [Desulfolucanica intricata]|uniref:histidine kinase dimerization/phospho-acceptor domain-containing protein n=1 Tax=Desulfolucanica intricata TaxID=1285191 RepID=UPI00082C7EE4|nr:histidine kinase dimerization/phospho-acceptor domain-containing protein [Desulfolucanica intricata]
MKRILAAAAYELKNPLTILQGVTRLCSLTSISEEEQEYFHKLTSQKNVLLKSFSELTVES